MAHHYRCPGIISVQVVGCVDSVRVGDLSRYVDYTPVAQEGFVVRAMGRRSSR